MPLKIKLSGGAGEVAGSHGKGGNTNRLKLDVYSKDFTFLKEDEDIRKFIEKYPHANIGVQRIDPDLLQFRSDEERLILLFNKEKKRIGRVGIEQKRYEYEIFTFWRDHEVKFFLPERVEAAIARIDPEGKDVFYICVLYSHGITPSIIIYKPPRDFTLSFWLEELGKFHENELKESLKKINTQTIE